MIHDSVLDGLLVWGTIEADGVTRPKTYEELSEKEKLQTDYDLKATNIFLQGLPPDIYSPVNHHEVAKEIWDRVRLLMKGTELSQAYGKAVTQLKRPRNSAWFKEKILLVQAQEYGQVLDDEQLAFLADLVIAEGQVTHTTIPQHVAFQTDDLDAYDSDCDDISLAKVVLMANLSSYDSGVLFEVPHHDTYQNDDMIIQSVQEMQYIEK
ncbi:hypothetical protein Tco_0534208 [Tanacetum coccineum]